MNTSEQLVVKVQLIKPFLDNNIELKATNVEIILPLIDGDHLVQTSTITIGNSTWSGAIDGQLSIWYRYESESNIITFAGNDLVTQNTIRLHTNPSGTNYFSVVYPFERTPLLEQTHQEWNLHSRMYRDAESHIRIALQNIQEALKEEALRSGISVGTLTPVPDLSPELYDELTIITKDGQFVEFYNPEKTYGPDHVPIIIESTWGGTVQFPMGTNFANVIGSTHDPKINGSSWIQLWITQFGVPTECTSLDFPAGFHCSHDFVGGHCILGTQASAVPVGSNAVFIVPICKPHNNNNNIYMEMLRNGGNAVRLNNYMGW